MAKVTQIWNSCQFQNTKMHFKEKLKRIPILSLLPHTARHQLTRQKEAKIWGGKNIKFGVEPSLMANPSVLKPHWTHLGSHHHNPKASRFPCHQQLAHILEILLRA